MFLYPRSVTGEINSLLFQTTLVVIGVATFSSVLAAFHYYASSLSGHIDDAERAVIGRRGDRLWFVGYSLLFLAPSLILFAVGLIFVGVAWLGLWLVYLLFAIRYFPRVLTGAGTRT